jgi:hypothetical protein
MAGVEASAGRPVVPSRAAQRPLGIRDITLIGGFWVTLQETNGRATLEHCERWMERLGWLGNFDRVADASTGPTDLVHSGWSFSDSEVYKLLEALAWEYGRTGEARLDAKFRQLSARVEAAQDPDGYLSTAFGHPGQPARYTDLEQGHELYCVGHLLQAAVARLRTSGPDELVEVARKAADHVCETFGAGGPEDGICGHPGIEVGLMEFGRATGEARYIAQAQLFLDRRGHGTLGDISLGRAYFQDDVPVRRAGVLRGHAVRALYLSAAAVDAAVDRDDRELLDAVIRQWDRTLARRTHLTGGMGSRHQDEGFGEDWELPPDRAYSETCAGVASIMLAWRLYLATGEVKYADVIERTFFNVVATSPRSDGRAFFYANPLHQRVAGAASDDDTMSPRAESGVRAAWFDVSCCPTNVARTLATWQSYAASCSGDELTLLQYAAMRVTAEVGAGQRFSVDVETAYPDDGLITICIAAAPDHEVALRLRVPLWAGGATLDDNGDDNGRRTHAAPGFVTVRRTFAPGDEIRLRLPMAPRFTWPHPQIDAVRGCVAVERGPLVYCAESVDLPSSVALGDVAVDTSSQPREHEGAVVVSAMSNAAACDATTWPYVAAAPPYTAETAGFFDLALVPYHRWAERGPSAMRIWLPSLSPHSH